MSSPSVPFTLTDFEQQVLSDLAELKTHMRWIVGEGGEGKIQQLEDRVGRHEAYLQRFTGIATALASILTFFHLAIDYMRLRH